MAKGRESAQPLVQLTDDQQKILDNIKPANHLSLPKGYLSHTQVDMYLRCARQYFFRYVRDHKRPPSAAMALGSGAHKALEGTHHHIVKHGAPAPTEAVLDEFSVSFEEKSEDVPEKAWTEGGSDKGQIKDAGIKLVRLYNEQQAPKVKPQVKDGVPGIEKRFEVKIGGVPMVGVIDLIDVNSTIVLSEIEVKMMAEKGKSVPEFMRTSVSDLKVKAKSMSQGDVDGSLQLTLYSYVEGINSVRYDQLLRQKTPKFKQVSSTRTTSDHLWMQEVVTGVAKAISAGIFPPCDPTSWVCSEKWCGYFHQCRGKKR